MEVTIIADKREEYEKRVKCVRDTILRGNYALEILEELGERQNFYHNCSNYMMFHQSGILFDALIKIFQKEAILSINFLEDKSNKANSLRQLKVFLHKCLNGFADIRKKLSKLPDESKAINRARNQVIAHIDYESKPFKIKMHDVKTRVNELKDCFNSYLFAEMKEYEITDKDLNKIKNNAKYGIWLLFSGVIEKAFTESKKQSNDEDEG